MRELVDSGWVSGAPYVPYGQRLRSRARQPWDQVEDPERDHADDQHQHGRREEPADHIGEHDQSVRPAGLPRGGRPNSHHTFLSDVTADYLWPSATKSYPPPMLSLMNTLVRFLLRIINSLAYSPG